jgi:hypothetical protein
VGAVTGLSAPEPMATTLDLNAADEFVGDA